MYWFYILKEVNLTNGYSWRGSDNVVTDVFIAANREAAKKHIQALYPGLPFRKPKNAVDGTRYLYLTDSNEYWYNYHHGEMIFNCQFCSTETTVVGEKNIIKHKSASFCSDDCVTAHEQMMKDTSEFIHEDDHFGIGSLNSEQVIGYIYKITNKRTMASYVGQTVKPPLFRWWQHLKVDGKFEQADLTELVFEVLEIVTFNPATDTLYKNAKEKMNKREAYYIRLYDCVEEGYNAVQPKEVEVDLFSLAAWERDEQMAEELMHISAEVDGLEK